MNDSFLRCFCSKLFRSRLGRENVLKIFQCWFHTFYTEYCNKDNMHDIFVIKLDFNAADFVAMIPFPNLSCRRKNTR